MNYRVVWRVWSGRRPDQLGTARINQISMEINFSLGRCFGHRCFLIDHYCESSEAITRSLGTRLPLMRQQSTRLFFLRV